MSRPFLKPLFISLLVLFNLGIAPLHAASNDWLNRADEGGLNAIGVTAYGQTGEPRPLTLIVASIIKVFLGVLGVIFVILILVAGFRWMTAGGNDENIKKATAQIRNAAIGLLIILAAYAITTFVTREIMRAVTDNNIFS